MPWYSLVLGGCGGLLLFALTSFAISVALERRKMKRLCLRRLAPALAHHNLRLQHTSGDNEVLRLVFVPRTPHDPQYTVAVTIDLHHMDTPCFSVTVHAGTRQSWDQAAITVLLKSRAELGAAMTSVNSRLLELDLAEVMVPTQSEDAF